MNIIIIYFYIKKTENIKKIDKKTFKDLRNIRYNIYYEFKEINTKF
jgi:hypothetical protein